MFENINWCFWLPVLIGIGSAILGYLIGSWWNRRKNQDYIASLETRSNEYDELQVTYASLQQEKQETEKQNIALQAELADAKAKLEEVTAQLKVCQMTVEGHESTIGKLKGNTEGNMPMAMGAAPSSGQDADAVLAGIQSNREKIAFGNIGISREDTRDNLLKINHITPWQEAKLNAAGINSYLQLARMQDEEMAIIAEVADIEEETIKTDDWKGQARALIAAIAANTPKDNLKKIEGIGPKIEQLCFNNGIYTFRDLAHTEVSVLTHILREGGARFRMHNPGTWPKQAEMAADGEWEALKKWQDELDGGR